MKVRTQLALTVVATGLLTALLVIGAVLYGYQRFEREINYRRSSEFLMRVVGMYDNLLDQHDREPAYVTALMKNLLLFEPDVELYLLDGQGTVLASTIDKPLPAGYRVSIEPVRQAAAGVGVPYVMGDDPGRGDSDAVVAAQTLRRATIRPSPEVAGYLYLVCPPRHLPSGRLDAAQASFGLPALGLIVAVVALTTLLAAWVSRPSRARCAGSPTRWPRSRRRASKGPAGRPCRRRSTWRPPPSRATSSGNSAAPSACSSNACASNGPRCAGSIVSGARR